IGEADFLEIYINTPIEICEQRDVKGLYKKARRGEIADFSGITSPYEAPEAPALEVKTEGKTIEESTEEVFQFLIKKIAF
ncbi:MAG: adenylyl-sulfate kinase, partial [Saprospiraceae bacterium]